ncbi:biotin-dependent carboxyltransferase family protein [Nocardioides currus]|uniref:Allophanate hydrolase n=1 Tax=Nocardioides currus TaxID=2133958 RepID=A0A2R7YW01_9ACTN|nr:biotin-dependent carboxyltransferase family protein [Nocardioides currus]PUA80226.1 allophanate hydrolase [Nocardioides currus]
MGSFDVLATGPLATVQDLGRPGLASLGVGRSGAADRDALRLANRLVGNEEGAASLEVTFGGLAVRSSGGATVALTGAPCPMHIDGRQVSPYAAVFVPDGAELRLEAPESGLRSYLAVRGGIDVAPVLGSRSTDTMAGLGPDPLSSGDVLAIGAARGPVPGVDVAAVRRPATGEVSLRVVPGPRADWFTQDALETLLSSPYDVTSDSNRVGMRLSGAVLDRARDGELPSEGMVPGALQVPPSGQPTLFLADHPVTGGYPVIGVVVGADLGLAAQARPGQQLRFRRSTPTPHAR